MSTTVTLQPIQTEYKGHVFRSRLEARWAVFFDTLGVRYEYEKEGFNLDGLWYLPDFWLSDLECWVEIKPNMTDACDTEAAKRLRKIGKSSVFTVFGNPWVGEYAIACSLGNYFHWGTVSGKSDELWVCCERVFAALTCGWLGAFLPDEEGTDIVAAFRAARSARFEHGQSGPTVLAVR